MYTWYQAIEMAAKGTPMCNVGSNDYMELRGDKLKWCWKDTDEELGAVYIYPDSWWIKEFVPYVKKVKLTDDEKVILRNLPEEYKWIARDGYDNNICVFSEKPHKKTSVFAEWDYDENAVYYIPYSHLFQQIKWEDEEPTLIADLLKE